MNFSLYVENLFVKARQENVEAVRREIDASWVKEKIDNYVSNWGGLFTAEEIKQKIITDELCASFFAKDPKKQNIPEKEAEKLLGVPKLPASGKNCIRFNDNGDIVHAATGASKSADFLYDGYYATQKYTTSAGGAQDNQKNDVIDFLKRGSLKHKVMAIVDGEYWDTHIIELRRMFAENPNVIITSLTEITGG